MAGFGVPSPSAQLEHGFVVPYTAAQLQQGREAHMREEAERHELRMHKLFIERQEGAERHELRMHNLLIQRQQLSLQQLELDAQKQQLDQQRQQLMKRAEELNAPAVGVPMPKTPQPAPTITPRSSSSPKTSGFSYDKKRAELPYPAKSVKKHKGAGKDKVKGGLVPTALKGCSPVDNDGNRICFGYNLPAGCSSNPCSRGLHKWIHCGGGHSAQQCQSWY